MTVYLVMTNGTILAAYVHRSHAEAHQLTITGARVHEITVMNQLAKTANDDIFVDEWDESGDTPLQSFDDFDVKTPNGSKS